MAGILLGVESGIPEEVARAFRDTGTAHIIAIIASLFALGFSRLLARWRPLVVLLSVAADDRGGQSDPETLQAVEGYSVLRTDRDGWIRLSTDGEQLWVEIEK